MRQNSSFAPDMASCVANLAKDLQELRAPLELFVAQFEEKPDAANENYQDIYATLTAIDSLIVPLTLLGKDLK